MDEFAWRLSVRTRKILSGKWDVIGLNGGERDALLSLLAEKGVTHPMQPGLSPRLASTVSCLLTKEQERGCSFLDDRLTVHHLLHVADFPLLPHHLLLAARPPLVLARGCRRVERGRTSTWTRWTISYPWRAARRRNEAIVDSQGPPGRTCTGLARCIVLALSGARDRLLHAAAVLRICPLSCTEWYSSSRALWSGRSAPRRGIVGQQREHLLLGPVAWTGSRRRRRLPFRVPSL